ncbi:MAG: hypothetical protein PsegKO_09570 [Pseudohongiellaceae bacterium]|jgi:nucleotide-binding universal stress UspA family protein
MSVITHILVPTDGSEGALKAAKHAADMARALNARLTVLFVLTDDLIVSNAWGAAEFTELGPTGTMPVEDIRNLLEKKAREKEMADTLAALGDLPHDAETAVVWGHVADAICNFASEKAVDLLVIGSHGRTGVKRMLLGSVSHVVANQAPCPVTIVR